VTQPPQATPPRTLLEEALPVVGLSRIVAADRRTRDPVYLAHRWFARRPPALLRGILLAASLPAGASHSEYWSHFADGCSNPLAGLTVYDPFHGGGTTLIEAGRLGAHVAGRDIDPVASRLVRHQFQSMDLEEYDAAASALLSHLKQRVGFLYPTPTTGIALHYFSFASVECSICMERGLLYRNLIIARGAKRHGSVARAPQIVAFCPTCFRPKSLPLAATHLRCCGIRHNIATGTWQGFRYRCSTCGSRQSHAELSTGRAPRVLVAVEETNDSENRTIRAAAECERQAEELAIPYIHRHSSELQLPTGEVGPDPRDGRPGTFGITKFKDMFTSRQLAVLGTAFSWVGFAQVSAPVRDALRLAISNALTSNNRMCGYATDYGRLSALFSVRGYSLPALTVELNALHPTGGRGTLARTLQRVRSSRSKAVRRNAWNERKGHTETFVQEHRFDFAAVITAGSAVDASPNDFGPNRSEADLVVTDPPYFDFIQYDRLSAFYRAWSGGAPVAGAPLLPDPSEPRQSFGLGLGVALRRSTELLTPTGLLAFTYHSTDPEAWGAVAIAIDEAKVRVTALWPVLADPHMGHHGTAGACQYDLVVVARPISQAQPIDPPLGINGGDQWLESMGLTLSEPDRVSALLAYKICSVRWGAPYNPAQTGS
jgi:putative DNA methylase